MSKTATRQRQQSKKKIDPAAESQRNEQHIQFGIVDHIDASVHEGAQLLQISGGEHLIAKVIIQELEYPDLQNWGMEEV